MHLGDASGIGQLVTTLQASGYDFRFLLTARSSEDSGQWKRMGDIEYLRRVPTGADVNCAYHRLVTRLFPGARFNDIPAAVARKWANQIPDLVVLTLALERLTERGRYDRHWEIKIEDAARYLREQFIDRLSAEDDGQVLKIAALALLEIPTSLRSLGNRVPQSALDLGLVRPHASLKAQRYELVHHELGKLIISFADPAIKAQLGEVMAADPFQATYIGLKLIEIGENDLARELLSNVLGETLTLSPDFSMGNSGAVFGILARSGVVTYPEIEGILIRDIGTFLGTRNDIVTGHSSFLGNTAEKMPNAYIATLEKLAEPGMIGKIQRNLRDVGPTTFANLYRCAKSRDLPFLQVLRKFLNQGNRLESFAHQCRYESPGKVALCCDFIEEFFPHHQKRSDASLRTALAVGYIDRLSPDDLVHFRSSRAVQIALASTTSEVFKRYITFRDCSDRTLLVRLTSCIM